MNIIVFGNGVMANILADCVQENDKIVEIIDPLNFEMKKVIADIIIDFSNHNATKNLIDFAKFNNLPIFIATTGQNEEELYMINEAKKDINIKLCTNTSVGINLINEIVKNISKVLYDYDVEIIEKHHRRKIDAPSGTALTLAKNIQETRDLEIVTNRIGKRQDNQIGISSVRAGNIVGEHSVIFAKEDEIIEIKHTALSRKIFGVGAIRMAKEFLDEIKQ